MAGYEAQLREVSDDAGLGPGRRLRLARERRELSVAMVADSLHLEQRVVEALEGDRYEDLPPVTFTRGYLRSYARLVGVPEEDVLEGFDRLGLQDRACVLDTGATSVNGQRRATGMPSSTPWLLIFLAAAVLAVAWWFWYNEGQLQSVLAPMTPTEQSTDVPAAPAADDETAVAVQEPRTEVGGDAPGTNGVQKPAGSGNDADTTAVATDKSEPMATSDERPSERDSTNADGTGMAAATSPSASEVGGSPMDGTFESTTAAGGTVTSGDTADESEGADAQEPTSESVSGGGGAAANEAMSAGIGATSAQAANVIGDGPDKLVFEFSGESWMEVTDAQGQRLLFGLAQGGTTRTLRGASPFEIVVGDVAAVTLRYNGDPVSLESHASGRVARFSLNESG